MKTPGAFLRDLREKKGYSLQRAAGETNISLNYIQALENDEFDKFPGEPYLMGFLKTYADYLGVSHEQVLSLYENYKLAESPIPMHELMSKEKFRMPTWVWGLSLSLVVAMATAFFVIPYIQKKYQERLQRIAYEEEVNQSKEKVYSVDEQDYSGVLRIGDSIILTFGGANEYRFTPIKMVGSVTELEQQYNDEPTVTTFSISLGEEKFFSLGGSNQANFVFKVLDVGLENGNAISIQAQKLNKFSIDRNQQQRRTATTQSQIQPEILPDNLMAMGAGDIYAGQRRVILSMRSPIRIEINILFTGNSNFRYLLDGRESQERYYQEGEKFQRSMNSTFRLWTANAGKTRLKIGLHEVVLGKDGEVVVKTLRWVYNPSGGGYDLILEDFT
ncbi:MAG: helix-turn-helix domain-containing protein [Spirochaetia bacterium]